MKTSTSDQLRTQIARTTRPKYNSLYRLRPRHHPFIVDAAVEAHADPEDTLIPCEPAREPGWILAFVCALGAAAAFLIILAAAWLLCGWLYL